MLKVRLRSVHQSNTELDIYHTLGRSYTEANDAIAWKTFCNAAATKIFVTLYQIILYCVAVLQRVVLQQHYVAMTKDTTSLD